MAEILFVDECTEVPVGLYEAVEEMAKNNPSRFAIILAPTDSVSQSPALSSALSSGGVGGDEVRRISETLFGSAAKLETHERLHGKFEPTGYKPQTSLADYDELAEISGFAQSADGTMIPREGWEQAKFNPEDVQPKADHPNREFLLAARHSPAFNRIQRWLARNADVEGSRC